MSHERLAALIQARRAAHLSADPEARTMHELILRILAALDNGEITAEHAQRVLGDEATRIAAPPSMPRSIGRSRQPSSSCNARSMDDEYPC